MTLLARVGAWQGRLSVTDLGELSVGGVFDEIDISVSVAKKGLSLCAAPAWFTTSVFGGRRCEDAPLCLMLPQPRSSHGVLSAMSHTEVTKL